MKRNGLVKQSLILAFSLAICGSITFQVNAIESSGDKELISSETDEKVTEDLSEEQEIEIADIEIDNYQQELNVGAVMRLNCKVLPEEISDVKISYRSSDASIATVNSSGEIKGLAKGQVIIYIASGKIEKEISLTVNVATQKILLNKDYLVLKQGDTFQLQASVYPIEASDQLFFESLDDTVATVDDSGRIRAMGSGNTSVIVSNKDIQTKVSVIVNEKAGNVVSTDIPGNENSDFAEDLELPESIEIKDCPVISKEMLRHLYKSGSILTITGEEYDIYIDGNDIVNSDNEILTDLQLKKEATGISFVVNNGKKLCGKITLNLKGEIEEGSVLYLYNENLEKYQKVKYQGLDHIEINTAGKYLLTTKSLNSMDLPFAFVGIIGVVLLVGGVFYIKYKKPYLFW